MFLAKAAILFEFDPFGVVLFVFEGVVVALLAILATQRYLIARHRLYPLLYFLTAFFSASRPPKPAGRTRKPRSNKKPRKISR
jgi:hypothetical protein